MERFYWLNIFLFLVGGSLLVISNYRNIVIGYRTPRSIKSDRSWKYANMLSGIATMIFSIVLALVHYLITMYTDFSMYNGPGAIVLISYFVILIIVVELNLKKLERNERVKS